MEEEQNFWPQTVLKSLKLQVADYKKLLGQNVQHCNYVDTVNLCKNNQVISQLYNLLIYNS